MIETRKQWERIKTLREGDHSFDDVTNSIETIEALRDLARAAKGGRRGIPFTGRLAKLETALVRIQNDAPWLLEKE